ncbi:M6 family metalloprotease domain-containing protein, partial [Streptomyces sp. SID6137]|nr:M6 family metalloprotease domain-containing protein [Streptomyces sp. SID6137]
MQPQPQSPRRISPDQDPSGISTRRIPSRRMALAAVTALTLAITTSAGTARLSAPSTAGPTGLARTAALSPCMIHGGPDVQMSEGVPTPHGYARSTGTVHALTLMVDFSDAPGEGSA